MAEKEKFMNPYNFISFPAEKASAYTDTDRHTGVMEYCITTKTPLFIPNSSTETAFKESSAVEDHKHIRIKFIVPGSPCCFCIFKHWLCIIVKLWQSFRKFFIKR